MSADALLQAGSDLTGMNLFAYCGDNPINGLDPNGDDWRLFEDWDWSLVWDWLITIGAGQISLQIYLQSQNKQAGFIISIALFGLINNTANAHYYDSIPLPPEEEPNLETGLNDCTGSAYVDDGYISRWDRLKYAKAMVRDDQYTIDAWQFYSEYNAHMYGWFVLRYLPYPDIEERARKADVLPRVRDKYFAIRLATDIMGILGE